MRDKDSQPKDWKEARRRRALELQERGWKQGDIAEALGISPAAVSQWVSQARAQGAAAWRAKPRPREPRKLTREQFEALPELLSHGAEAYGFCGDVWTCARVATVIRREFGVSYHKAHVSRLLQQLRWTPQLPIERAAQRNEQVIQRWRTLIWPELEKRR
ncbi:MAG: hypothetical protein A2Z21_04010 [Candidatus Fraserbacteria bacterium RBG_16_55_9]|uniref:Uncharacterized protein n=1 Tax=Fraserbacteria sp. (strain RBG_16_55_9) TaxID=1817864 RepID=A0A1F5V350_FRAXR|nr:MAG: hypothetical protein A2Z21_04010 [Candidatus Fraserbacteria bacterium RBG_16_55_9]